MMRIAAFLLVAVLLSTCVISGTFAKFTTEFTGTGAAQIATWDVKLNDATAKTFTFNLFDTLKDSDQSSDEENVDDSAKIIAPGTSGSFAIKVTNSSQVDAKYTATFTLKVDDTAVDEASCPIKFTKPALTGNLDMNGDSETLAFSWLWDFTDADETAYAGKSITVVITVTVDQVD